MELLRGQAWVATVDQLGALGVGPPAVSRARHRGLVDAVAPGLVGLHGVWDSFDGRVWAAQLIGGDGAFVSGPTAARLYGLRGMPSSPVEVTIPETAHRRVPPWVRLVKTSWRDDEPQATRGDGLSVASPLRMLFGLARCLNQHRFERAAEDAWHLGLVTPPEAARYLAQVRRRGLTGVARFEAWVEVVARRSAPAQSGLEQYVVDLVHRAGLPDPVRQHALTLRTGDVIHLDVAWPEIRLAIEPGHTWWHGGDLRMRADQDRDRACAELGWLIVRYDESVRTRSPRAAASQLALIYRRRSTAVRPADPAEAAS
jgi:hypothetical protein